MEHFQHHSSSSSYGVNIDQGGGNLGGGGGGGGGDRFPQWSIQETRDFLMIRAELDPSFMETKRNKVLWEVIGTRMKERGYVRSAEQCKSKWKNLVTRYKGCETMESESMRQQFPFYNELQEIFAARIQRMLWQEAEGGGASAGSSKKKSITHLSSDEEEDNEADTDTEKGGGGIKKKRKVKTSNNDNNNNNNNNNDNNIGLNIINNVKEMLDDFMKQQMEMENQWMKAYEEREEERRMKEMEWKQRMEALERERMVMEMRWRERDEQRRIRDEARAEKRDALYNALLNKLRRDDA